VINGLYMLKEPRGTAYTFHGELRELLNHVISNHGITLSAIFATFWVQSTEIEEGSGGWDCRDG
jgi:hypothetical protein